MLFSKPKYERGIDENGVPYTMTTFDHVPFKDKKSIDNRNVDDYLANIWMLAAMIREGTKYQGRHMLFDSKHLGFIENKKVGRIGCSPLIKNGNGTKKRMCRCMIYYNKDLVACQACKSNTKMKNMGGIVVKDYEALTWENLVSIYLKNIDILLNDNNTTYATVVKPKHSKETIVHMMAEIYTACLVDQRYQPAICFFKDSRQHEDFCNPTIYNDTAFQYLLTQISVFYITTHQVGDIVKITIHNNALEPLLP